MDATFWKTRWKEQRIGFHEAQTNSFLHRFSQKLSNKTRVLVPLCGKSYDMVYLAEHGFQVQGVELVENALLDFFTEQNLSYQRKELENFVLLESPPYRLYAGDFFQFSKEIAAPLDCIYDRAAIVALTAKQRANYAKHILQLLPASGQILLVGFFYDQNEMNGPPFSVTPDEVEKLFSPDCSLEVLAEEDALITHPQFREKLSWLREWAGVLHKK